MSVCVRLATPQDAPAAQRVSEEAFASLRTIYRPSAVAQANRAAISKDLRQLVAEKQGRIVGTVRFGIFDNCLRVIGLAVAPQNRRRGVARALIEELARIASQRGCQSLSLYTVTQTGNVPIFQRLGFKVVSEQPDRYSESVTGESLTESYMVRDVAHSPRDASVNHG